MASIVRVGQSRLRYTGSMRLGRWLPALFAVAAACAERPLTAILERVSEEAEAFHNVAPRIVGHEVLRQKAARRKSRFRLRIGQDALKRPPAKFEEKEIVSEYGFATFPEAPESLHELRHVVSVDGRQISDQTKARETLTLGLTGRDDRIKKKLLRQFERYGLAGAAMDFGQLVLLFRRRHLPNYQFQVLRESFLGASRVRILGFRQREGPESLTIFEGRSATQAKLEGELWVREADFVPLRITLSTAVADGDHQVEHRGAVDYFRSSYGVMLPASVHYEKLIDGELAVENVSAYSSYQMFSVDTEIRFTPTETPGPPR